MVAGRNARARRIREAMVNGFGLADRLICDWEGFVWSKGEAVLMLMPCGLGGKFAVRQTLGAWWQPDHKTVVVCKGTSQVQGPKSSGIRN
jgi:hypothetical protein